jgi:ankyrin repeat protein
VKIRNKRTALHEAAGKKYEIIIRLLLKYKTDIDAKNYFEKIIFHEIIVKKHEKVMRLLLNYKTHIDAKDNFEKKNVARNDLEQIRNNSAAIIEIYGGR